MQGLPENIPMHIYGEAWHQLYNFFGERLDNENQEIMNSILQSVLLDEMDKIEEALNGWPSNKNGGIYPKGTG